MARQSSVVLEISQSLEQDDYAKAISFYWQSWNSQRGVVRERWKEVKEYVFATDTNGTANSTLPWSNKTTIPKLCQIRDNLHSNYISAIFPNDKWLQWLAYSKEDATRSKSQIITAYMDNKTRLSGFRTTVSSLLLDYIDYGNAFATAAFEKRYNTNEMGEMDIDYIGPVAERISPEDIVFNPLASKFKYTPKIVRSIKTIGELLKLSEISPDYAFWKEVVSRRLEMRNKYTGISHDDWAKASQYSIDGFGSMQEYYRSDFVEILELYGDMHVEGSSSIESNRMITVVDRCHAVRNVGIPTTSGTAPIYHAGWRKRPDNLWAMGPLENLIGMQYRIDHIENMRADAMDLAVMPPLKIKGEVEEFVWGPRAEIHLDENGDVDEIATSLNSVITAANDVQAYEDRMELYSGAPREAMGIRTPGEKTAFEVGQLMTAAGRIFQEKTTNFEISLMEPLLNGMLEQAVLNLDEADTIRVIDTDLGVAMFKSITKDDIQAKGIVRPVGARHFAQQSQDLQNLIGIVNTPLWQQIAPHTSSVALTNFVEDILNLSAYSIFRPNVAVMEQKETMSLGNQAQEEMIAEQSGPTEMDAPMMEEGANEDAMV